MDSLASLGPVIEMELKANKPDDLDELGSKDREDTSDRRPAKRNW